MNYTDEQMDEIAATMRGIVSCLTCGDLMHGLTRAEATEDAINLGWEYRTPGGWRCPGCLDEEAAL